MTRRLLSQQQTQEANVEQTGEGAAVAAPSSETRTEIRELADRAMAAWREFDQGDGSEQAYEDALAEFHHVASPWLVLELLGRGET